MKNVHVMFEDNQFLVEIRDHHPDGAHVAVYDKEVPSLGPLVQETILLKDIRSGAMWKWVSGNSPREIASKAARAQATKLLKSAQSDSRTSRLWSHLSHVHWDFDLEENDSAFRRGQNQLNDVKDFISQCFGENPNRTHGTIKNHPRIPEKYREPLLRD